MNGTQAPKRMSRRHLLLAAAGACVAGAAGLRVAGTGARRSGAAASDALVEGLAALVLDDVAAARLGRQLLAERPALPRDRAALALMILPEPEQRRAFAVSALDARTRMLRERIDADFGAGRTAEVDGWVLAETEALLAALAAAENGV
ncbi:MAG TPA: hypothetical protein VFV10_18745 [Gammaproteobacteria bacterium]|nr:hypothetical protein [Gammaproteobacteria bacterium]